MSQERGWKGVTLTQFRQDTLGGRVGDEEWPPTFNWAAHLLAERSDGVSFYVGVALYKDEVVDGMVKLNVLRAKLDIALRMLEEYRVCGCTPTVPCAEHLA